MPGRFSSFPRRSSSKHHERSAAFGSAGHSVPANAGQTRVVAAGESSNFGFAKRRRLLVAAIVFWIAASIVFFATNLSAQEKRMDKGFDVVRPGPAFFEERNVRRMESVVAQLGRGVAEIDPQVANAYFNRYVPGVITNPEMSIEANEVISSLRKTILRADMRGEQAPVDTLANFVFRSMGQIANGNYYPPARVMAITLIGELNSRPISLQEQTPPEPYTAALVPLYRWATAEDEVDGVRAAALVGLERHLSLRPLGGNAARAIGESMRSLLDGPRPNRRDPAAHAFMQRMAVNILASLNGGADKTLGTRLVAITGDSTQPDLIALHSAETIGRMPSASIAEASELSTPESLLQAWSTRMLHTMETELERLELLNGRQVASSQPQAPETYLQKKEEIVENTARSIGSGFQDIEALENDGFGNDRQPIMMATGGDSIEDFDIGDDDGGGRRMREAQKQPPEIVAALKKINYAMQSLHAAAAGSPVVGQTSETAGLVAAVSDDKKPLITAWTSELAIISEALNDPFLDDVQQFEAALETQVIELQSKMNMGEKMMGDKMMGQPVGGPLGGLLNGLGGGDAVGGPGELAGDVGNDAAEQPADFGLDAELGGL